MLWSEFVEINLILSFHWGEVTACDLHMDILNIYLVVYIKCVTSIFILNRKILQEIDVPGSEITLRLNHYTAEESRIFIIYFRVL